MQLISLLKGILSTLLKAQCLYELKQNFKTSKSGWYNKGSRFPRSIGITQWTSYKRLFATPALVSEETTEKKRFSQRALWLGIESLI